MKADVRPLFGEHFKAWEISINADAKNADAKLLKRAARLVRDLEPDCTYVSGTSLAWSDDVLVLYVFASRS